MAGNPTISLEIDERESADIARLILLEVERMRGDLGSFARGLSGNVRILSNTAALSEHLPKVLAKFLAA